MYPRLALVALSVSTLLGSGVEAASYSPTLDINNATQLTAATAKSLQNLLGYYSPGPEGAFNQIQTPWAVSGQVWGTYMDYLKYTADGQFSNTVTDALVNMSFGPVQDFLDGAQAGLQETILGKWNDDLLWPSQAFVGGAEIYGASTILKQANGTYMVVAQKTFDQAYQQWSNTCGGGIFWSRDRQSPSANYKSSITNLEFIQQGARNYIQSKNTTAFGLTRQTLDYMLDGGLVMAQRGIIYDGYESTNCGVFEISQWSYNYGAWIGALAWMHEATQNQTYIDLATPFIKVTLKRFFNNTGGVMEELCEAATKCNRDQMTFKGILARNLAYFYRVATDESIKTDIMTAIDTTVAAMVSRSCDVNWNCGGNWTTDTAPVKYVASQIVSSSLLVAAVGIHTNVTGSGLLTNINLSQLKTTPSGTGTGAGNSPNGNGGKNPYVESRPLNAAPRLNGGVAAMIVAMIAGVGIIL